MPRTRSGIATVTSHAPSANFVQMTTSVTRPVAVAPMPLTSGRQVNRRCVRSQYRTIPACESVNAVKTPMTYRWMRLFVLAP